MHRLSVFITGAAGLQSLHASDLFDWQSRLASIGPSITWPVFEGGRIRANIALQTATQEEELAAYEAVVLQAFQDVEDALVAFFHQQAAAAQLATAVHADQRAADLARDQYAQGLTDFLNVLVAEQTLFTTQDTLAQSQRDVALDLVALYKAVGGGWEARRDRERETISVRHDRLAGCSNSSLGRDRGAAPQRERRIMRRQRGNAAAVHCRPQPSSERQTAVSRPLLYDSSIPARSTSA